MTAVILFSCETARLSDARDYFARGEYHAAAQTYRELYRNTSREQRAMRGVIAYEMAENYRRLNRASQAAVAYRNAIRYGYPDTLMYYHYAQMLQQEGNYESAGATYTDFLALLPDNPLAIAGLKGAEMAIGWNENPTRYRVRREPLFNSNRADFSPMLSSRGDRLYFTSSREATQGEERSPVTGTKYTDIFYAETNVHGEWKPPKRIETGLNSDFDEGTPSFSPNGEWMYYTASYGELDGLPSSGSNLPTGTGIYVSRKVNGEWSGGRALVYVEGLLGNTKVKHPSVSFAHPAISSCGNYLYFVSDMPGGYGGKDIWRATLRGSVEVTAIENMGPEINTPGDEMFPYSRNDSTFYFSSNGHPGMGGLDLFMATRSTDEWGWEIENMLPPINSYGDDFGITFFPRGEKGFFSSNRDDTRGYDHIYSFEFVPDAIRVEGMVVDPQDELIPGATVSVVGSDGSQRQFVTNHNGEYRFTADAGVEYLFLASVRGFLNRGERLSAMPTDKDTLLYVDFEMIPFDKPVVMENIFYDFDSAVLRPESKDGLEELVDLMNEHPEIFVEVSAHTDRKGSSAYNMHLSLLRSRSVVDYLIARGIDKDRLTAVGYGKSRPEIVHKKLAERIDFLQEGDILSEEFIEQLSPDKQEIADQVNRRTSFQVIGSHSGTHGK